MATTELRECEECGRKFPPDELGEWFAPAGWMIWVCNECLAQLENEL
jgi:hypothetical protein